MTHFVHVPLRLSDEVIEIPIEELPDDHRSLVDILREEEVSLDVWLQAATGYYNTDRKDYFIEILESALTSTPPHNRDRIKIYNAMASYYTERAYQCTEKHERKIFMENATAAIEQSEQMDNYNPNTWLCKGLYFLYAKSDVENASAQIRFIFDNSSISQKTPALIGRGVVYYHQKKYAEALDCFKEAMLDNPVCIQDVRIGMGLCYYHLGREILATRWLKRVLKLNPKNTEALLAMAIISFNKPEVERKKKGYRYIVRAYNADPCHPRVLNYLARYYFHRREYEEAESMASKAARYTKSPFIKAESEYIQGRILQAQRIFDQAMRKFESVLSVIPNHALARHGLAQMKVFLGDMDSAVKDLVEIQKTNPHSAEVSKLLGSLNIRLGNKKKAIHLLEKVVIQIPHDFESWVELAQLREHSKISASLQCYETALLVIKKEIMARQQVEEENEETDKKVPAELWNNLGAVRHRVGNYEAAEFAYLNAIASSGFSISEFRMENITSTYNLARLYEDTFRTREAIVLHTRILKEHPNLIECYLRLASIAMACKRADEATQWINGAFAIDLSNVDAWTISGNHYYKDREWKKSQQQFEHIIENINKEDNYALLSLANIYFQTTNDAKIAPERVSKFLRISADFYKKVLASQPNNVVALSGIACILAHKGKVDDAYNLFVQVRENTVHPLVGAQTNINLTHLLVKQKKYAQASKMLAKNLKKFYHGCDKDILLYLAHSHFCAEQLLECKRALLNAIHMNPMDTTLWFNLGITQSKYAALVSKKTKEAGLLPEANSAIVEANQAIKIFQKLIEKAIDPTFKRKYSATACKQEVAYCKNLLTNLDRLVVKLKEMEKKQNVTNEKHREIAAKAKRQLESIDEIKAQRKREEEQKMEAEAERSAMEQKELVQQWQDNEKKRKRDDLLIDEDEDRPSKKRKKKASSTTPHDAENSLSDSEPEMTVPLPIADETIEETRIRRGGHLNSLVQDREREESSRKEKMIERIRPQFAEHEDPLLDLDNEDTPEMEDIRKKLKVIITEAPKESLRSWKVLANALKETGLKKTLIKQNKAFIISTATALLQVKLSEEKKQ